MNDEQPPDPPLLRVERTFNAPRRAVFDSWTSGEVLKRWWRPAPDWETPVAEADVRVGGKLRIVMRSPEGDEIGGGGEYVEVRPPERLVFTWIWEGQQGDAGSQLVEVEFYDEGSGTTRVVVTNRGLRDEEERRSHREGGQGSLANLERALEA